MFATTTPPSLLNERGRGSKIIALTSLLSSEALFCLGGFLLFFKIVHRKILLTNYTACGIMLMDNNFERLYICFSIFMLGLS